MMHQIGRGQTVASSRREAVEARVSGRLSRVSFLRRVLAIENIHDGG